MYKQHNKPKISVKTDKQLNALIECSKCGLKVKYKDAYMYVDGNNVAITNNSKTVCKKCKT